MNHPGSFCLLNQCNYCRKVHLHDRQVGGRQVSGAADEAGQRRLQHVQHRLRVRAGRQCLLTQEGSRTQSSEQPSRPLWSCALPRRRGTKQSCCFKRVNVSCELQLTPELSAWARPCGQDNAAARALPFSSHTHTLSSGV